MRRLAILLALVLALGAGWYFGSPWWTLRQMRAAAEAGDAAALSAHVDYPAVRESIKGQLKQRFGASRGLPHLGRLGGMLAGGLADAAVEAAVSPAGLDAIFSVPAGSAIPRAPFGLRAPEMNLRYEGPNQFRLVSPHPGGGALVFRRHGIGWKLAGVTIPENQALLREVSPF